MMVYANEQALVDDFLRQLAEDSPWGAVKTCSEFFYQRGRTDVVAVDSEGNVIAFEAKLTRWRAALQQAYRNTCFAHRSYVVLPKETALRASQFSASFCDRRVGLCYLEKGEVVVLHEVADGIPLQPWLSAKARQYVSGGQLEHVPA